MFEEFIRKKFETMSKYIDENAEKINSETKLSTLIEEKLDKWIRVSYFLTDKSLTLEEYCHGLKKLGMKGAIEFYLKGPGKTVTVVPKDSGYERRPDETIIDASSEMLVTVSEFVKHFDAEIFDIYTKDD